MRRKSAETRTTESRKLPLLVTKPSLLMRTGANHGNHSEYIRCFSAPGTLDPLNSGHGTGVLSNLCLGRPACLSVRASTKSLEHFLQ